MNIETYIKQLEAEEREGCVLLAKLQKQYTQYINAMTHNDEYIGEAWVLSRFQNIHKRLYDDSK